MIEYGISLDPRTLFDIDILGKERINPINVGFRRWSPLSFCTPPPPRLHTRLSASSHPRTCPHPHACSCSYTCPTPHELGERGSRTCDCLHRARGARLLIVLLIITWPTQPRVDTSAFVLGMWAYALRSRASSSGQNVLLFVLIKCLFKAD